MKNPRLTIVIVGLVWGLCSVVFVFADSKESLRHIPVEQILEFSLFQLQESLSATRQRNEELTFQNMVLRREADSLRRRLSFLDSGGVDPDDTSPADQGGLGRLEERQLSESELAQRAQRTEELIGAFKRDIQELSEKVRILDYKLDEKIFQTDLLALGQRKAMGEDSLSRAEKRYKALKASNERIQAAVNQLLLENEQLVQGAGLGF